VWSIVNECDGLFHAIEQEDDFGLDAHIELPGRDRLSGQLTVAQIKSGASYRTANGYAIPGDREHFLRWLTYSVPVAGIVYDPATDEAYWTNITAYLKAHEYVVDHGPWVIPVSREHVFDIEAFRNEFRSAFWREAAVRIDLAGERLHSESEEERWVAVSELGSALKMDSRLVLHLLIEACADEHLVVRTDAVQFLSRYLLERGPGVMRSALAGVVSRTFDDATTAGVLETLDKDNGFHDLQGQAVEVVLREVPEVSAQLLNIARDNSHERRTRFNALLLIGILRFVDILPALQTNVDLLTADGLWEPAEWAVSTLSSGAPEQFERTSIPDA
jgi:hypothetical protein